MNEKTWAIKDIIDVLRHSYIFEDELISFKYGFRAKIQVGADSTEEKDAKAAMRATYNNLSKAIRRVIRDELSEGEDYSLIGDKDYAFTEFQARHFLRTSRKLHNYCLRQMQNLEETEIFQAYFEEETNRLNEAHKAEFVRYVEERDQSEYYFDGKYRPWLTYTKEDIIMKTLLDGLFENSVDVMLDRLGIDAQAYLKDFNNMEKLIIKDDDIMPYQYGDPTAPPPLNRSYGYYHYKIMRPLVYYRKWDD